MSGPSATANPMLNSRFFLSLASTLGQIGLQNGRFVMVLIAPAVDFTEELMWKQFSDATKREIQEKGKWLRPSEYGDEPYPITRSLIEDGRNHLLLGGLIETGCPVHILQGVQDPDVPWRHACT